MFPPPQQHPCEQNNNNLTIVDLAPKDNMDQISRVQPQSPFPSEVDAFTQSYQFSPILPTFARTPSRTSTSIASQDRVRHQITSDSIHVVRRPLSSHVTGQGIVGFDLDPETSLGVEEPIGLGISFAPLASTPWVASRTHRHDKTSQSVAPSTPKNRGRYGGEAALAPFSTGHSINFDFGPKDQQTIDLSKLNSGFTPLKEQEKGTRVTDYRPTKKSSLFSKETTAPSTPILPTTTRFGPPLHSSNTQKQRASFQSSNDGQASSSNLSQESFAGQGRKYVFTALDQQHLDFLSKEMEQLSPEMLDQVEIRMVGSPSSSTTHTQREPQSLEAVAAIAALKRDQKQRLDPFSKEHHQSMEQSMSPMAIFVPISQIGLPRPIIKLKVPPSPLTEFHLFSKLPTEIQHHIWEFSVPDSRTVCLTAPKNRPGLEFFQPKNPPPGILQVCAQARAIALRTLQPTFENTTLLRGACTFFNFEIDVLRLSSGGSIETAKAVACAKNPSIVRDRERVRHLEIPFHIGQRMRQYNSIAALIVLAPQRGWPALKTLTFPGCPANCHNDPQETYRMPVIMVQKKNATVEGLMEHIKQEFRDVWAEFKDKMKMMPDCGLKVVYLDDEDVEEVLGIED
ncbi:hypothetical protein BGZ57DRAFT_883359 [Hyaloscypha finlandica]|nr:hypothetical protein BGZ57DRAFT_883359 [Hyaloscypha finlandica]